MTTPALHRPVILAIAVLLSMHPDRLSATSPQPAVGQPGPARAAIDFGREVRPILSNHCFKCHGPDSAERQAGLRLDERASAIAAAESGQVAIVPGKPADSELVRRIFSDNEDERMPPPDSHKSLTAADKETLKRWVSEGAAYSLHWSFAAPSEAPVPAVKHSAWARNEIDRFVLERLQREGIEPSREAGRATLARRLSLDLRGLPPSLEEVDAFVADDRPDAYEELVDRLLASPHYGEKMAQAWLDLARFGDTNGYQDDGYRSMWPYRDWVIAAFNANKRFDQFTIEQLAGDLLPSATLGQKIASGFNRNHRYNEEGGADPDEFLVAYAIDRTNTTGAVWLGLTVGCAQCHDHKYDPISQKEYYQLYAFFNSLNGEIGVSKNISPPLVKVPTDEQQNELESLSDRIASLEGTLKAREPQVVAAMAKWERQGAAADLAPSLAAGLVAHYALDRLEEARVPDSSGNARHGLLAGLQPVWVDAASGRAAKFDGAKTSIDLGQIADFERHQTFSYACWFNFDQPEGTMLAKMDDAESDRGYEVSILPSGQLAVRVVHAWPDDALRVVTKNKLAAGSWHFLAVSYDGSSRAGGVKIYVDGKPEDTDVEFDRLTGSIRSASSLRLGRRESHVAFRGAIRDLRVYERVLTADEIISLHTGVSIERLLAIAPAQRSPQEQQRLRQYWLERYDRDHQQLTAKLGGLVKRRDALDKEIPTSLVMEEMQMARAAYVLARGDFEQPGERVTADVPAVFPPLPSDAPRNRLSLAKSLVSGEHPLTARVAVNRIWMQFFGSGLVRTPDDFGAQGQLPTHPQLLDWLARDFVASGWDIKALQKKILTSATYRQTSVTDEHRMAGDPYNRLLARATRFRLAAEEIRDSALKISGLLSPKMGGPSVFPYQPASYLAEKSKEWHWDESHGADRYRRGLYTFWRRTTPYPALQTFDAPSRELCTISRPRTNTPLQALVTLNDPTFVDAARALAARILAEAPQALGERLRFAFRLAVAREPSARESEILERQYLRQKERYLKDPQSAQRLTARLPTGNKAAATDADPVELAAWTAVSNVLLNLDETLTRE